tara:strand:- start:1162 stop:1758 length:597 start_codon:yes stop_codon:yes gene_type:complete
MISIKSLTKSFGHNIISNFSYEFASSSIYFLSGKNGAGKTTLLKLIKGIYIKDSGSINFKDGIDRYKNISYVDNNFRSFFHRLTVLENLDYFSSIQSSISVHAYTYSLLDKFNINHIKNKKFSDLSNGQMQLISIIRSFASSPKIVLIDEAFSSLDKINREIFFEIVNIYVQENDALVICASHEENFFDRQRMIEINI